MISAGRYSIVITALSSIMLTINAPTVMYGVRGAKSITENADAKRTALRIIPLPGLAAVQSNESVKSDESRVKSLEPLFSDF